MLKSRKICFFLVVRSFGLFSVTLNSIILKIKPLNEIILEDFNRPNWFFKCMYYMPYIVYSRLNIWCQSRVWDLHHRVYTSMLYGTILISLSVVCHLKIYSVKMYYKKLVPLVFYDTWNISKNSIKWMCLFDVRFENLK